MYRTSAYLISIVLAFWLLQTSVVNGADPNLVGWWNLNDGFGNVANDTSGNGNDGTLEGNPNWIAGKIGLALEFDGIDDYIDCGNDPRLDITGPITIAAWVYPTGIGDSLYPRIVDKSDDTPASTPGYKLYLRSTDYRVFLSGGGLALISSSSAKLNAWNYVVYITDGTQRKLFLNGAWEVWDEITLPVSSDNPLFIGDSSTGNRHFEGILDEVRIYNRALTEDEIQTIMPGEEWPYATNLYPVDGVGYEDTSVTLRWLSGGLAISHNVYFGDNFDEVNEATQDSEVFRGNQILTFYGAGFPGYPYPDGLVPGTTYYWRIDEVNGAELDSPWKGDVWNFSVPSNTAYNPEPIDDAGFINLEPTLNWTAGFRSKVHTVYFGEDYETVANATEGISQGATSFSPGRLKLAKTYYWRVDEFDGNVLYKGDVWSFTTEGMAGNPEPPNGAVDIKPTPVLKWDAGKVATLHEVYFGTDADVVANATKESSEYKGSKDLGEENYDPGQLELNTTYFWRIEEANNLNPDSPWAGNIWSFTTGNFFVIDDFEDYNADDKQIWFSWHDGLGYGIPGTAEYYTGNRTGAAIGDETTPSYTEETIVHDGSQSMPVSYSNNKQDYLNYSEVEYTLSDIRDWTTEGVAELSLWFRGNPPSVGSFVEGPVGTYTMTASGADIWIDLDEFHFAYKRLTGPGMITVKVESLENTDPFAKGGVMIRNTLDPGSVNAALLLTPSNGVRFQYRLSDDGATDRDFVSDLVAPLWLRLERDFAGNFRGYYSSDGVNFERIDLRPTIPMDSNVYIGLALTSHNVVATCRAVFSGIQVSDSVSGQWQSQDVGIASNDAEPLFVAVSNSAGTPAVVVHDDPVVTTIDTWTEWVIPLQAFVDQGIVLTDVDRIAIGIGTRGNMTVPGGSGKMYFDDIRLYRLELQP